MKIEKAETKDVEGCLKIQESWKDNFFTVKDFKNSAKDKDAFFLVAVDNGEVVGFITGFRNLVKRNEAVLQNTMVEKKLKRKGIGKKLVIAFCDYVKKKGVSEIFTELEKEHVPFYVKACKFKDRGRHILAMKKLR
jgi:N-acetylglutamate synthase-like GNAT family acetyltransferase